MARKVADRVLETSVTTGTGALTLAGAITGYRAFSAVMTSPSDTCYYTIQAVDAAGTPTGDWEVGLGTYSASNTLTRTTVIASSNANAAVNFAAGTKQVWLDFPAAQLGGSILQVVQASIGSGSSFSTSSSSFVDTGYSASITPRDASSRIMILFSAKGASNVAGNWLQFEFLRNASTLVYISGAINVTADTQIVSCVAIDSPATASAVTYNLYLRRDTSNTAQIAGQGSIILLEIAG
jgi:hypothetical protein